MLSKWLNHLSCLILKQSHHLETLRHAYEDHCNAIEERLPDAHNSSMKQVSNKYKTQICDGFLTVHAECDTMLKLTSQKQAAISAENLITKKQNTLARLDAISKEFHGIKSQKSNALTDLTNMNKRSECKTDK